MPDLHARLLAEIERREEVATTCRSVHSGWWHVDQDRDPNLDMMTVLDGGRIYAYTDLGQDARFIADNDPHTVLAYLAALRTVVERHAPMDVITRVVDADGTEVKRAEPWCSNCENDPYPCADTYTVARALDVTP